MKRHTLFSVITTLLISGCSGERLLAPDTSRFSVDSVPPQATVYVMEKPIGVTPTIVRRNQVFPQQYPRLQQHLYGTVTLHHPDCQPYRATVSNRILEQGLTAQLQCNGHSSPGDAALPAAGNRERLLELESLYQEGLITEQEYRQKRGAIVEAL